MKEMILVMLVGLLLEYIVIPGPKRISLCRILICLPVLLNYQGVKPLLDMGSLDK